MNFPRRRTAIVLAGYCVALVLLGYQTPAPSTLKAVIALVAVLILPGWSLATAWPSLKDRDIATHLALSVPLSLVLVSAVVLGDFVFPLGLLNMVALLFLGTFVLIMMAHKLQEPGRPPSRMPVLFWISALILTGLCFWGQGPTSPISDGPAHVSTVREIMKTGELFPHQGLVPPETVDRSDPRMGVLHIALAMAATAGHVDSVRIWKLLPGVLVCCLFSMLFIMGRVVFLDVRVSLLGAMLTALCLGGEGARWLLHLGYGAHVGLWIAWAALWVFLIYLKERSNSLVVLMGLLLMAGEAVHPLSLLFFLLPTPVMLLLGGKRVSRGLLQGLGLVLLAVAPILLLRYGEASGTINPLHHIAQPTLVWGRGLSTLWPGAVLQHLGWLGCVGILSAPVVWKQMKPGWERDFLLAAVLAPLALTLVPGVFDAATNVTSSFPIKSLFEIPAFFLIAWCVFRSRTWQYVFGVLSIAACLEILPGFQGMEGRGGRSPGMEATLTSLQGISPPTTVIADPAMSYLIAAETEHYPITVLGQHGHPLDGRGRVRLEELATVFSDRCPVGAAQRVLDFYGNPLVAIPQGKRAFREGYGWSAGGRLDARRSRRLQALGGRELSPGVFEFSERLVPGRRGGAKTKSRLRPPGSPVANPHSPMGVVSVEYPDTLRLGSRARLVLWWKGSGSQSGTPVEAHIRLEAIGFHSVFKPLRKLKELLGLSAPSRFRVIHTPFRQAWPAVCWGTGEAVGDTLGWMVPRTVPPGRYAIRVGVLEQEIMPRIHIRDVLWEQDRWQGAVVGTLQVLR